jgi:flagellar hook-associated protein 2
MSTLSVSGLASGLDTNAIISALVAVKRAPIDLLEGQKSDLNSKLSAFGTLNDLLNSLETTANSLNSTESFRAKDGSSKDEGVVTVTATGSANTGSFSIVVNQIAKAETFVADGVADQDTTAIASASGTLSFTVGSGSATEIAVTASTTLENLRDAINLANNAGVTASIVNDGSGTDPYRLVLRSDTTGTDGNITFNQNDTDLTFVNSQADQDASITLDGIDITTSTNTITDVIEGVTIELVASGSTTFTISNDTDTVTSKINEFVEAYNSVKDFVDNHSTYDPVSKIKGVLFGDSTLLLVEGRLREIMSSSVSGLSGTYTALSQIGIRTNEDGDLTVDSDELSTALDTDFLSVSRVFIEDEDNGTDGVLQQLSDYLDYVTDPIQGLIDVKEDGLQSTIEDIQDLIDDKGDRLLKYEEGLILKYASLESYLSQSQSTADYLTSTLTAMLNW